MQGTNYSGEGGRRACYLTPNLSYDLEGERKRRATITNGTGIKKKKSTPGPDLLQNRYMLQTSKRTHAVTVSGHERDTKSKSCFRAALSVVIVIPVLFYSLHDH